MAWNPFLDISNTKPLFLAVYTTVLVGIVFSTVYVVSSLYPGKLVYSEAWSSSPPLSREDSLQKQKVPIFAQPSKDTVANVSTGPESELAVHSSYKESMFTRPIWDAPSAGTKMPDLKAFRLAKEMVKYRAKDNIIIVTFGNYAFMDFIINWVKHLTDLRVFNLLVGAMDTKLLEALYWKGIPVFDMGSNINIIDVGWGSSTFHKMGREKVILINALLPFGFELLMCDTDMVWLKNPLPYLARFPRADVLTSSDQVIPTVVDDSLEIWQQVSGALNIGIFHWRPTNSSKKLAKEWKEMLLADETIWDQNGFNELMHRSLGSSVDGEPGLVYAFDGNLKMGILPASIFCSGHTYFVQAMYQQLKLEPYAVHTTFQYAGTEGKRHRLREAMVFYDQPEYYDSPGGFLTFRPNIPRSLLLDGDHTVDSHFSLVNFQLKQIRIALAITSLLNRTLVMPPLWCRLDRLWFGHPGALPGTMTRQPFLCPMDHVFEVNVMLRGQGMSEEEFGPNIGFREYSFLENTLLPEQVKASQLEVQLCDDKSLNCISNGTADNSGVVRLQKHSSEEVLTTVFSSYQDVKVIKFSSMEDALGFTNKVREAKFRNRVKRYVGMWCCMENRDRGHIYYDMFWDEKPGWRPVPPATPEDDRPPW
ncbi:arabinosyltransferase XEG113-like [Aristolochia californica]|uniref:arabinosyltransferase XEG113-like n=1 Tax=Aristolochia californica TaxID=171875 RepID=UPI0035DDEB42